MFSDVLQLFDYHEERSSGVVYLFGRSVESQKSVCVIVEDFLPTFCIKTEPVNVSDSDLVSLREYIHALNVKRVKKKDLYGYQGNDLIDFIHITMPNMYAMRNAISKIQNQRIPQTKITSTRIYNNSLSTIIKLLHQQDITACSVVNISGSLVTDAEVESDLVVKCSYKNITKSPVFNNGFVIMSFDIETLTLMKTAEDLKYNREAAVIQIGTVIYNTSTKTTTKYIFTWKTCADIPGIIVKSCASERDLIMAFDRHINEIKPDFLIGYNIYAFDLAYLVVRAENLRVSFTPNRFYKHKPGLTRIETREMESKAYGSMPTNYVATPGIAQIDLLPYIRREYKLGSYKLGNVSSHFIQDTKDDIDYLMIRDLFHGGTPEGIAKIGKYCVQDCALVLNLCLKLCVLSNLIEMANVTAVPVGWLMRRGQQIKVFSQLCKYAKEYGYLVPDSSYFQHQDAPSEPIINTEENDNNEDEEETHDEDVAYKGATVLTSKSGAYLDDPVINLDFASLYPSIIIAHNLCFTTLITEKKYAASLNVDTYGTHSFIRPDGFKAILPTILMNLLSERKAVKKQMKNTTDEFQKELLNSKQLALKVVANSLYGFCGAMNHGMLPCIPIASTVTRIGREMIEKAKKTSEDFLGSKGEVIYGDTDSLYIKINCASSMTKPEKIKYAVGVGNEVSKIVNAQFQKPCEMVFDNVMFPMILLTKKRYFGLKYEVVNEIVHHDEHLYEKGLVLTRRNYCPAFKKMYRQAVDTLLYKQDIHKVIDDVRDGISRILNGTESIEDFVITASLQDSYNKENVVQAIVAKKIAARNNGVGPVKGERVPFVYIVTPQTQNKKRSNEKSFEKVESVDYVIENHIDIDYLYYVEHQIQPQLTSLLELFMNKRDIDLLFNKLITEAKRKRETTMSKVGFEKLFKK